MVHSCATKGLLATTFALLLSSTTFGAGYDTAATAAATPQVNQRYRDLVTVDLEGDPPLVFSRHQSDFHNYFYQHKTIAAHMLTKSIENPRVMWMFPAGNTGIALWFEPDQETCDFKVTDSLRGVTGSDHLRGIQANLTSSAKRLRVKKAILGNIRTLRDYLHDEPQQLEQSYTRELGEDLILRSTARDEIHRLELRIVPKNGTTISPNGTAIEFFAGPSGLIELEATALTNQAPLVPFAADEIVTSAAGDNPRAFEALRFLAYHDKLLAGSWRFLTYFGRDTLLALKLLMPVLTPQVIEAGLASVLDRVGHGSTRVMDVPGAINNNGAVAHEEALGDYAWFIRQQLQEPAPPPPLDAFSPWLDYKMIDGDFILPILLADYLAAARSTGRIATFLARTSPFGESYRSIIQRNLARVHRLSFPFYKTPETAQLIKLIHPEVGNWRDSEFGLGGGVYPYDVNAALVPAALRAGAELYASGLFGAQDERAKEFDQMAQHWLANAPKFFEISIDANRARQKVEDYAARVGLDAAAAVQSIKFNITYRAVALDHLGRKIPIMNSDDSFALLFTEPSAMRLREVSRNILRPFPAGLRTEQGIVVANPVFANIKLQQKFTRGDYHGTVIWSWQQAMLAAGLERQLRRTDLDHRTRRELEGAQFSLWQVIHLGSALSTSELWSWKAVDGRTQFDSFIDAAREESRIVDESNSVQLWSTVYLSVRPPANFYLNE